MGGLSDILSFAVSTESVGDQGWLQSLGPPPLEQDQLAEQFESGTAVELPLDLLDAVHSAFCAAGAPVQGEAGGHRVEVSEQVKGKVGEAGQLAGTDGFDPCGERGAQPVSQDLAETADMFGRGIQFWTASQDILQRGALVFAQG